MEIFIDKMHVEINLDINESGIQTACLIAKGFAEIEKNDLRISKLVCNSTTKDFIIKQCSDEVDNIEKWFWGAEYVTNESIETLKVVLISECCFCEDRGE